jgi:type II secretory pathway pseudopilin PulG
MKNFQQKGTTLGEILLAIAIVGIITTLVSPGFAKIKKIQVLKSMAEEIVSAVEEARSLTLSSVNSSSYGVHFETNKVIIFTGTSFSSGAPGNKILDLISPVSISNINLSNSDSDMYFYRLSGLPNATGTVTLSVSGLSPKTITISTSGSVSSN